MILPKQSYKDTIFFKIQIGLISLFQKGQMTTLVVWQVTSCVLIRNVSGEYYNKNQSHLIIWNHYYNYYYYAIAEIYRVIFAGKSVRQILPIYR